MNYENLDLDNRTCAACGLPEAAFWDPLCPEEACDQTFVHVRCFNSPAARAWCDRQRKLDPAYDSYLRLMKERAPIDCRHCGRKLELSPKPIGPGGGWVNCTRCYRTSRHGFLPFDRLNEQAREAIKAIAAVQYDFMRSLNLESIDRRMHEIRRKYNYLAIHGLCECGGAFSLDAKARCPFCQQVAIDSYVHRVDAPQTPEQPCESMPDKPWLPPADWNDAAGWTRYFSRRYLTGDRELNLGGKDVTRFPDLFRDWWERGWWKVWFPGCGISPLPQLFASFGFTVHATDIAQTAVSFQEYRSVDLQGPRRGIMPIDPTLPNYTGQLVAKVHDMRTSYRDGFFDVVINTDAFAGFPVDDRRHVARSHLAALKSGGRALFDVVARDADLPNDVERILASEGFHVPNLRLNRRARGQLAATGIPHIFLLGRPVIPRLGVHEDDELRKQDTLILREIISRYAPHAKGIEAPPDNSDAKTAVITYSHI